jgi:phosphoribosylamine--glycine ligase
VTDGGRVLCATALGDSIKLAQRRAYEIASAIRFEGVQYRRDIGFRAIAPRKG